MPLLIFQVICGNAPSTVVSIVEFAIDRREGGSKDGRYIMEQTNSESQLVLSFLMVPQMSKLLEKYSMKMSLSNVFPWNDTCLFLVL